MTVALGGALSYLPPMQLKHFVITRIGLGIYDPSWYERAVALFLAVTGPSLKAQLSQEFDWLIVIDAGMPPAAKADMQAFAATQKNFHLVETDVTQMDFMRLGGHDWIWQPCLDYILGRALVEDPSEYVITSIIDADDAWANDYVQTINHIAAERLSEIGNREKKRGSHLRHSDGAVITLFQGLYWFLDHDTIKPLRTPFHSMAISVIARLSSGLSAISNRHAGWKQAAEVANFEIVELPGPHPMWLYTRHELSVQHWTAEDMPPAPEGILETLQRGFGIDLEKVRAWRQRFSSGAKTHDGASAGDRYSQLFALTALNRQIAALENRAGADPRAAEILERQRAVREALLDEIRRTET